MATTIDKVARGLAVGGSFVLGGLTIANSCFFVVNPGERAILFSQVGGVKPKVYGEGVNFKLPFIETPIRWNVRCKPREIGTQSGTKDQQNVFMKLRVLTRPVEASLPALYNEWGLDYDDRILPGIGNEILKAVVAKYNAEELITRRSEVSQKITEIMKEKVQGMGILLDDVALVDLQFSNEFMNAVEMKQVEQQEAARREHIVAMNEYEKQAAVTRAQGDAEAARLISDAIAKAGPGLVELRAIDAKKEIAKSLATSNNVQFVPGNVGMFLAGR